MNKTFIILASILVMLLNTNVFAGDYSSYKQKSHKLYHGNFVKNHLGFQNDKIESRLRTLTNRAEHQVQFKKVKGINRHHEQKQKKFYTHKDHRYYCYSHPSKYRFPNKGPHLKRHSFKTHLLDIVIRQPGLWFSGQLHH